MAGTTPASAESGFLFVGGGLALDLVNTEIVARGRRRDLLESPEYLHAWWDDARDHHAVHTPPNDGLGDDGSSLAAVKALRSTIRQVFEAVSAGNAPDQAVLDALNEVLQRGEHVIEQDDDGQFHAVFRPRAAGVDTLLVPIAWSALELLTTTDPARLHACANEKCILLFHDTTKSGTRRWCSTGCMNRARSAERYRAEQRSRT
jgi:predicted RNA-binding Zn ribbon-like protein